MRLKDIFIQGSGAGAFAGTVIFGCYALWSEISDSGGLFTPQSIGTAAGVGSCVGISLASIFSAISYCNKLALKPKSADNKIALYPVPRIKSKSSQPVLR